MNSFIFKFFIFLLTEFMIVDRKNATAKTRNLCSKALNFASRFTIYMILYRAD